MAISILIDWNTETKWNPIIIVTRGVHIWRAIRLILVRMLVWLSNMGSVPTITTQSSSGGRVKCLNDWDNMVLISNFKRRGWVKGSSESEGER